LSDQIGQNGTLQVVPESVLQAHEAAQASARVKSEEGAKEDVSLTNLASYIQTQFEIFTSHRNSASGWSERLLSALRAFNGQYDATKLAQIKEFGGSEVYARVVAMKCRGASALLRDVYLSSDRPWGLDPPDDPDVPAEQIQNIQTLVQGELHSAHSLGGDPSIDVDAVRDRIMLLMDAARAAAKKKAAKQANVAEDKIEELLVQGGFYKALAEIIVDIPLFPIGILKGPVVRIVPTVSWAGARATIANTPRLFWNRVSPFDLWFTPGVADIEDASVIERTRVTRADLNDLLDLPGYDTNAIRAVLEEYGRGGLNDNWDRTDTERAQQENRENPNTNRSGLISCLEFHGNVQGTILLEQGMDPAQIPDPVRDYMIQAWKIGRHIIKVQMSPSPRKRHPYFVTSFEKVPGTPVGNGLPDILQDVAEVSNAVLRALVNNLSISSGPQVVINTDRLAPDEDAESMFPWKRWHTTSDPLGNNAQMPISFFQPVSNANELLATFGKFNDIADELSAIPKYLSGGTSGGAGRTAAGLAMLMGNASKILQTVSANMDRDIVDPALGGLFDMLMLTDESGLLTGEERVRVRGVSVAMQRETQRSRQIEFLTATANPIDANIMGPKGRAAVLRSVSTTIGMSEPIVPGDDELEQMHQQQQQQAQQDMGEAGAEAQGGQKRRAITHDIGPRTPRIAGGAG